MKLVNFGAGEIADRLTILALKIQHAATPEHFRTEQVALLAKLKAGNGISGYVEELIELATVNGRLWRAEDDLRGHRSEPWTDVPHGEVAAIAFRIQELNDRRAQLIEAINVKTGEHRGSEKVSG